MDRKSPKNQESAKRTPMQSSKKRATARKTPGVSPKHRPPPQTLNAEPLPSTAGEGSTTFDRRSGHSILFKWIIPSFSSRASSTSLYSPYFEVAGFDCRLALHSRGSLCLHGHSSLYLQIVDPGRSRWSCYAFYKLHIINHLHKSKSLRREAWYRFSDKHKLHGWADYMLSSRLYDPKSGFLNDDSLLITADVCILSETVSITHDIGDWGPGLSGKVVWEIANYGLFADVIKGCNKITSPEFRAEEYKLFVSIQRAEVDGVGHLALFLESKDLDNVTLLGKSIWCLFRMTVLSQKPGVSHRFKDSYGRFGDVLSIGWNDFMRMSEFSGGPDSAFVVDGKVAISVTYHVILESCGVSRSVGLIAAAGKNAGGGPKKLNSAVGKIVWRIEHFTKLKELLKKRKIEGFFIKSAKQRIANQDFRLVAYPRGKVQPPCHLSVFLEVTDSQTTSSYWSSFVYYRLSLVNQKMEDKSITKESQFRFYNDSNNAGWSDFVNLTTLFNQDSGLLVQDGIIVTAEILILKEHLLTHDRLKPGASIFPLVSDKVMDYTIWGLENLLSFKEIMRSVKIFSEFFEIGGCELQIGVHKPYDTIGAFLEYKPSFLNDPDKCFWVSYKMVVVNQRDYEQSISEESSFFTRDGNNSLIKFMDVPSLLEADAGFLVHETVVFILMILDCSPWFDFSGLEVLDFYDNEKSLLDKSDDLSNSQECEVARRDVEGICGNILAGGIHPGDTSSRPQVDCKEIILDAGELAGFLDKLIVYLNDPIRIESFLPPAKLCTEADAVSATLTDRTLKLRVLQETIVDQLLDVMVTCCKPSDIRSSGGAYNASAKVLFNDGEPFDQSEGDKADRATDCPPLPLIERMGSRLNRLIKSFAQICLGKNMANLSEEVIPKLAISSFGTRTDEGPGDLCCYPTIRLKWSEQPHEVLGVIVGHLKALYSNVPQGCQERGRRHRSQKISIILQKVPEYMHPDFVSLIPKLVDHSEHSQTARTLLHLLQRLDAESALQSLVLAAINLLDFGSEVWEELLSTTSKLLLVNANGELIATTISFLFQAASRCHQIPQAVATVQVSLRFLGAAISSDVMQLLSKTVSERSDIATAMLKEIDFALGLNANRSEKFSDNPLYDRYELLAKTGLDPLCADFHFTDAYILTEMFSIPSLTAESFKAFEKAVIQGSIDNHLLAKVLGRCQVQGSGVTWKKFSETHQDSDTMAVEPINSLSIEVDFTLLLGLAQKLMLSGDPRVHKSGMMFYSMLFKFYADELYQRRMLKGLVSGAIGPTNNNSEVDAALDVLVFLVHEKQGVAKFVLSMMMDAIELANVGCATLRQRIVSTEDEIIRVKEERQVELSSMVSERSDLLEKLSESEAEIDHVKLKMKLEIDHFALEKKKLAEQINQFESQLEWLNLQRDEEVAKLSREKIYYKDRLHEVEAKLSQLKFQRCDEMQRVVKDKDALTERLKKAEAARRICQEKLKVYTTKNLILEQALMSLEGEVAQLKHRLSHIEAERQNKEEQVMTCEAYINGLEAKLDKCQQCIQSLKVALEAEILQHAPLYGANLEALSAEELQTLFSIHEQGLRAICTLQQQKARSDDNCFMNPRPP